MTDRLIPDPATARRLYVGWAETARRHDEACSKPPPAGRWCHLTSLLWHATEACAIQLDNAVALWISGDRPRGPEAKAVPLS